MDIETTLIGVLIIALCALPLYLMGRNGKKKRDTLLIGLTNLAKQHHQKLDRIDYGPEFGITISLDNEAILFYKRTTENAVCRFVHLQTIQSCNINQVKTEIKDHGKHYEAIERLELVCKPIVSQNPTIILEFYNAEDGLQLNGELELINKWHRVINENSNMKQPIKSNAREVVMH